MVLTCCGASVDEIVTDYARYVQPRCLLNSAITVSPQEQSCASWCELHIGLNCNLCQSAIQESCNSEYVEGSEGRICVAMAS